MYELNRQIAQSIVDYLMKDIPYNINIMDKDGVIIGSGHKHRIGTLHKGAAKAIKEGKVVDILQDTEYEKKGTNLPIEIDGEILGLVGISGEVDQVKPFGKIVRSTATLLIEQGLAMEKEQREKNRKVEFFRILLNPDTEYTDEIMKQAMKYDIDLTKASQVVYIEMPYEIDNEMSTRYYYPSFQVSNYSICSVVQDPINVEPFKKHLEANFSDAYIAISGTNDRVSKGFQQAKSALRVLKGIFPFQKWIFYEKVGFIADVCELQINRFKPTDLVYLSDLDSELIKTIQVYIYCNLNINEAAKYLNIHRNTMNYRLNRLHQITGKDPKNVLDLLELMFIIIQLENPNVR